MKQEDQKDKKVFFFNGKSKNFWNKTILAHYILHYLVYIHNLQHWNKSKIFWNKSFFNIFEKCLFLRFVPEKIEVLEQIVFQPHFWYLINA